MADAVEVALEYLIPGDKGGYGAGPAVTDRLAILNWYLVTLYPKAGHVRDIHVRANLTLPPGWQAGCALPVESKNGDVTRLSIGPGNLEANGASTNPGRSDGDILFQSAASNLLSSPAGQAPSLVARNEHEGPVRGERDRQ